jgi:indolepyruvate ferredoxin oxidoreductase
VLLDQVRRDRDAGRVVGGYVSGYPGSPLAGFDQLLGRVAPLLASHGIRFQLGLNEELAAAAVAGSQLVDLFPHSRVDGVIGLWFGKAPGVDRCLDVLRHANFSGISRFGGALAVAGDDPACKSSSLPSQSEHAFAHAMIPLLVPGGAAEVVELGLHGYALSRYAGVWAGLKLVADVCDGGEIVTVPRERKAVVTPSFEIAGRPFEKRLDTQLLPPMVLEIERDLVYRRLEAVRRYVYANDLDRIEGRARGDQIGFVAAGVHRRDLLAALAALGIDEAERQRLGIRLLHLAMVYPLEPRRLREFAEGLEVVVVLDDRRDFLEQQVRDALFSLAGHPAVLGRCDERGAPWLARDGALCATGLARDLGAFLAQRCDRPDLERRGRGRDALAGTAPMAQAIEEVRRPHFCSGCPHLTSTRVPEGLAAAGGIGCHTMVLLAKREMRFFGAMGSEGAHWNGLAPFVDTPHLLQNLGDGTYFHSGRQSIRACVAAGATITFKLLYNHSIAMTGGQSATGEKPVSEVARDLLADGVRKVIAMSDDSALASLARALPELELIEREQIDEAMERLAREDGVTVLLYDAVCANAKQRQQRRGLLPPPAERIVIQQDVCEGCGDCGRKSECLSVRPIETVLGRKTRIHQGSCSQDETCLQGDCPAFLSVSADFAVEPAALPPGVEVPDEDPPLPEIGDGHSTLMIGIGSTGVVTVDAILVGAARLEGLHAAHLDQTGLSQRGGTVTSHCRIAREPLPAGAQIGPEGADTCLAFDPLGAAGPQALSRLSRERTHVVMHEAVVATAEMVSDPERSGPSLDDLRSRLRDASRALHSLAAEELCTILTGEHLGANVLLLGFAFQSGAIPLSSRALEQSIRDHAIALDANLRAFRLGRALAAHPQCIPELLRQAAPPSLGDEGSRDQANALFGELWREANALLTGHEGDEEIASRVAAWSTDLADYQNRSYGERYLLGLLPLLRAERALHRHALEVVPIAARELYRLMAYKDEYEVARLHLRGPFRRWLKRRGVDRAIVGYWLHPPLLRALGLERKLRLGRSCELILHALVALRGLRGTPLDPFGYTQLRRVERELARWYEDLLSTLASRLESLGVESARKIAGQVSIVRGYEQLKLDRAALAREQVEKALSASES